DERIKRHRCGKAERLADDLIALRASVPREVGDIQRNGGPKSHHACQRGDKEAKELSEGAEFRRIRKHGSEAARFVARPEKERQPDQQQKRRRDALEEANRLDSAKNYDYVEQ